jgi:dTMP kinase
MLPALSLRLTSSALGVGGARAGLRARGVRACSAMATAQANAGRGALIVLEGLDRSGKSSQCAQLAAYLETQGVPVEAWRFPDRTTAMGQMISSYLSCRTDLDDAAIHLLFSANRWEKRYYSSSSIIDSTSFFDGTCFSRLRIPLLSFL